MAAGFSLGPAEILTADQLALPPQIMKFCDLPRGLVLVTGPTGSGKSTTLAAMIDHINANDTNHIMTIEDPIEFLIRDKRSIVNQREVGVDTMSFSAMTGVRPKIEIFKLEQAEEAFARGMENRVRFRAVLVL